MIDFFFGKSPYTDHSTTLYPPDLQGWGSTDQIFKALIEVVKPNLIMEIGSWKGASAIHMGMIVRDLDLPTQILCVDTWLGSSEHVIYKKWHKSLKLKNGYPQLYYTFLSNVVESGLTDRIFPLPTTSENAFEILSKIGVQPDMIYVDGAHGYNAVLRDLQISWKLLGDKGVLFGDDFLMWKDVTQAVRDFSEEIGHPVVGKRGKFVFSKGLDLTAMKFVFVGDNGVEQKLLIRRD